MAKLFFVLGLKEVMTHGINQLIVERDSQVLLETMSWRVNSIYLKPARRDATMTGFFCARSQEVMLTYIFILMSNKKSNWEIVERDTLVIISWGRYTSYRNLIMPFSELFIRLVPCMMKLKAQYTHRSGNTEMHSLDKEGLVHGRVWGLPLSALTSGMGCISYFCCFLLGSEFLGNDAFCTSKLSTVLKKLLFLIKKKRKKKVEFFLAKITDHQP